MLSSHVVIAIFQNQIKSLKKSMTMVHIYSDDDDIEVMDSHKID